MASITRTLCILSMNLHGDNVAVGLGVQPTPPDPNSTTGMDYGSGVSSSVTLIATQEEAANLSPGMCLTVTLSPQTA